MLLRKKKFESKWFDIYLFFSPISKYLQHKHVTIPALPVARTCSYRHRTVVMVTGMSSRKQTRPRYPKSFSLMRVLLRSETRSLLRILYKTCKIKWKQSKHCDNISHGSLKSASVKRQDEWIMLRESPVSHSYSEDSLSDLISEVWSEQQAVQLLHAPLQQHSLHMLTRGAASQEFIQHIQGLHHLMERGESWGQTRKRGYSIKKCGGVRVKF